MGRALPASAAWWVLAPLVAAAFLFGGSARGDVASLMFLRPVAILALGFGILRLQGQDLRGHRVALALAFAALALAASHLVVLPPKLWQALPGRALVAQIEAAAGLGAAWRPLSIDPVATRNALLAALVPFAALVLGMQLAPSERARIAPLVLLFGFVSAMLGILQTMGERDGPLYFYAITSNGAPTGLFANRNHQAMFLACLLPFLASVAFAVTGDRARVWSARFACALAALLLVPLILVTGSRMGIIMVAMGLLSVPLVLRGRLDGLRDPRAPRSFPVLKLAVPVLAAALAALTVWLDRAVAWNRLVETEPDRELRMQLWPVLEGLVRDYLPLGSGIGSFERVFMAAEPDALLASFYTNHAHNDWLELAMTGGLPALILAGIAVVALGIRTHALFWQAAEPTRDVLLGRAGVVVIVLLGTGSWADYPLRVPSLGVVFALAVVLACGRAGREPGWRR